MHQHLRIERASAIGTESANEKKRNLILVEDYGPNIMLMRTLFEELGFNCDVAETGMEALNLFSSTSYDAVIMDIQLPDIDGLETARRMRSFEKRKNIVPTPIIGTTGNATDDDRLFCLKAGMSDCLAKPLDLDELEKKLNHWLR
jgi:CheY-like chemotaxis protein